MLSSLLWWETMRMREYAIAIVCCSLGLIYCFWVNQGDVFLLLTIFAGGLGFCVPADSNSFQSRGRGAPDLAYLTSRPVGRMSIFKTRIGSMILDGGILWTIIAVLVLFRESTDYSKLEWWMDWGLSLMIYVLTSLAMIGLVTEPPLPFRQSIRRRSFYFKICPLYSLVAMLWLPIIQDKINPYVSSPAHYLAFNHPILFPVFFMVLFVSYVVASAHDWNELEMTS